MTDNFPTHIVAKGETLPLVAQKYGVPRDLIIEANINKIKDPNAVQLQAGQTLVIPARYTVRAGDTPSLVAEKYGVAPEDVVDANNRSLTSLQPGQVIYVLPPTASVSWSRVVGALVALLLIVGCLAAAIWFFMGRETSPAVQKSDILAPKIVDFDQEGLKVLLDCPVQIQSVHPNGNISRVELWVKAPNQETSILMRSDVPAADGLVLQEWVPQQPGVHAITLKTHYTNNQVSELSQQIRVVDTQTVAVACGAMIPVQPEVSAFEPPTPTPGPEATVATSAEAEIAVVSMQVEPTAVGTPVRHYPPPPAAPGVPYGPTQAELPSFGPPVCDAAQYLGVYAATTGQRVMITEEDDVPARTVGGTIVNRAWRMQNIGTCTWGTGYELAFYGGRSMGSGGVAFESAWPSEPGRRNTIIDSTRLVVPEGKPNQTAVLEVLLNVPVTPGIHQSYWRMRNPHGVYFGPIVGVTFEVVRECTHGTYGAPVINKFEIIGVGNVYRPTDPVSVQAKLGEQVTLDYQVTNATNFDAVIEDPTGNIQSVSSSDPSGRVTFTPKTLGRHTITLYADNGSCTVTAQVYVDVIPPDGEQFNLHVILSGGVSAASLDEDVSYSSSVPSGSVGVQWNHYDPDADQFTLLVETYRRVYEEYCPVVDSIFGWKGHCYMTWSDWEPVDQPLPLEVGGEGDAQGAAMITNLEQKMCPAPSSIDPTKEEYRVLLVMRAEKGGRPANPQFSNTVAVSCPSTASTLPTELQELE
ncbi:MAG: LysM peptidoglycan-binding domain-containing protein [Anaerolineae bacterium]|nr:LysM peptidoglycan-binding domain-containing protein [Anaerolineae bacterium]